MGPVRPCECYVGRVLLFGHEWGMAQRRHGNPHWHYLRALLLMHRVYVKGVGARAIDSNVESNTNHVPTSSVGVERAAAQGGAAS